MRFALCLVLWLVAAQCALGMEWRPCEGADDLWKPLAVSINPDPAVAGENIAFTIEGEAKENLDGGYLVASVSFGGMPIAEEIKDLCKRTSCPIAPGPVHVVYEQVLPPFVPPGSYEVQVQLKDTSDNLMMCLVVDFDINMPAFKKVVGNLMGGLPRIN